LELEQEKGKLAEDQDLVKAEKEMLSMQIDAIEEDIKAKTVCSTERKTIISS
jgi:fido (protein-threonine AMPylation protein)